MTTRKDEQNIQNEKSKSLIITLLNRLAAFIYSLFIDTWIGRRLLHAETTYDNSAIGRRLSGDVKKTERADKARRNIATVLERGIVAKVIRKISGALAIMSVNIYGMFFAVYGIAAIITYFVAVYALGNPTEITQNRLVTAIIITVCSIPFMSSTKNIVELFGTGKLARKISVKYLCIPEEKLKTKKKISGLSAMLLAAAIGLALGGLSFYISPAIVISVFLIVNLLFLIFAIPEVGILIIVTSIPFMQYIRFADVALIVFIVFTALAYVLKVLRGNRTMRISSPCIMVVLYCLATLVASSFSPLGIKPFVNAIYMSLIVLGGYFLGSNLTRKKEIRDVCIKILTVSLVLLAMLQFLNMYYMSISSGIEYSLNFNYRSIISDAGINVTYNVRLPGLLAAMLSPLLIAECFRQNRIYNVITVLLCFVPVIISIALYGTFEIMLALVVGVALYLIMYSHKTLTAVILLIIPVSIVFMLLPDVLTLVGITNIPTWTDMVNFIFPDNSSLSAIRSSVVSDIGEMIKDGNIFGIGVGEDTLRQMLAPYISVMSESATDAGTTYMQTICESGVFGLSLFFIFAFLLVKHSLKFIMKNVDRKERIITLAFLCGFITAVLLGFICCIYNDMQMRFLFWLCAGMLQGQIMNSKEKDQRIRSSTENNPNNTDMSFKV